MVLFANEQQVNPHFPHHLLQEVVGDSTPVQIGLEEIEGYCLVFFVSSRTFLNLFLVSYPYVSAEQTQGSDLFTFSADARGVFFVRGYFLQILMLLESLITK